MSVPDQTGASPYARVLLDILPQESVRVEVSYRDNCADFGTPNWEPEFVSAKWVSSTGFLNDMSANESHSWCDSAWNAWLRSVCLKQEVLEACKVHKPLRERWLQLERQRESGPSGNCVEEAMPERRSA